MASAVHVVLMHVVWSMRRMYMGKATAAVAAAENADGVDGDNDAVKWLL